MGSLISFGIRTFAAAAAPAAAGCAAAILAGLGIKAAKDAAVKSYKEKKEDED